MDKAEEKARLLNLLDDVKESLANLKEAQQIAERSFYCVLRRIELIEAIVEARNEGKEREII